MASIYDLKSTFQALLHPMVNRLATAGITANQVTVFAVLISLLSGVSIWLWHTQQWPLFLLPLVLFMRMALNAIDGMLAKEHNMQSKLGAVLNELGDVFSDSFLYLPFAYIAGLPSLLIIFIVLLSIISEMTGVIGVQIGHQRRYDGPMGKSDRAFVFSVIAILIGCGLTPGLWSNIVFSIITLLLVATIYNRANKAINAN